MLEVVIPDIALSLALPEIGLAILVCAVLILDLFVSIENKSRVGVVAFVGVVILALVAFGQWGGGARTTFNDFYVVDNLSVFVKVCVLACTAISILLMLQYAKVEKINYGELYAMLLFSVFGMLVMASGNDLLTVYLGLETMSISIYVLVAFMRHDPLSREAGLKYFLMGAFASGILLYGMALTYGFCGTTSIRGIAEAFAGSGGAAIAQNPVMIFGLILLVAGFGFKLALAPFHMWLPDAYTGAPTPITGFMSVAVKFATVAALMRIFFVAFPAMAERWNTLLWVLTAFTMVWGNVAAIAQTSLKRMLAYSSIGHAGYVLMGVVVSMSIIDGKVTFSDIGISAVAFYLLAYLFTNLGAFGMLILVCREGYRGDNIEDWKGIGQAHPWAGMAFVVFLLSLGGIPPTAGFVGKLYLFAAAVQNEYYWLAAIGLVMSAVSMYYYGRIIMVLYMENRGETQEVMSLSSAPSLFFAMVVLVVGTLLLGIFPGSFLDAAKGTVAGFI
ncbi:MAG: NADH-quinone oxidoreductase subunit N [Nitrospinae bacterium]|nr:NADH-quinone oxidoreductase subunit N [Nitrospinota bacterium]